MSTFLSDTPPTCREAAEIQLNIFHHCITHYAIKQLEGHQCAHVIDYYEHESQQLDADIADAHAFLQMQQSRKEASNDA